MISLIQSYLWKKTHHEITSVLSAEAEMYKTAFLLPVYLVNEVVDLDQKFDDKKKFNEESQFNEFIEYSPNFLYTPQVLRIYPDDMHQILRTAINSSALLKSTTTGKEDDGTSAITSEEQNN